MKTSSTGISKALDILIAIGKLASAIQNRDDVDITLKVRLDLDGAFGAPGTGSLMSGRTATVTEVKDKQGNSKFVWGKLDRPDILIQGDYQPSTIDNVNTFDTQSNGGTNNTYTK